MFPKIDVETARKNRRALAITMIAMLAFGMGVAGAHVVFGPSVLFFTVAMVFGSLYAWGVMAFIVRTEI